MFTIKGRKERRWKRLLRRSILSICLCSKASDGSPMPDFLTYSQGSSGYPLSRHLVHHSPNTVFIPVNSKLFNTSHLFLQVVTSTVASALNIFLNKLDGSTFLGLRACNVTSFINHFLTLLFFHSTVHTVIMAGSLFIFYAGKCYDKVHFSKDDEIIAYPITHTLLPM